MTQGISNQKEKIENESIQTIELRPYSKKELRELYGISVTTFRKWMESHGDFFGNKYRKLFTVKEIEFIFQTFGIPKNVERK